MRLKFQLHWTTCYFHTTKWRNIELENILFQQCHHSQFISFLIRVSWSCLIVPILNPYCEIIEAISNFAINVQQIHLRSFSWLHFGLGDVQRQIDLWLHQWGGSRPGWDTHHLLSQCQCQCQCQCQTLMSHNLLSALLHHLYLQYHIVVKRLEYMYHFHLNCIIEYSTKPNCLDHPERPTFRSRPRGHGLSHHLIVNLHLHLHHLLWIKPEHLNLRSRPDGHGLHERGWEWYVQQVTTSFQHHS